MQVGKDKGGAYTGSAEGGLGSGPICNSETGAKIAAAKGSPKIVVQSENWGDVKNQAMSTINEKMLGGEPGPGAKNRADHWEPLN